MNYSQEVVDNIGDEIRKRLESGLKIKTDKDKLFFIKDDIECYLIEVKKDMHLNNLPETRVENEGTFITINFFDNTGDRLETLRDMLDYMEK